MKILRFTKGEMFNTTYALRSIANSFLNENVFGEGNVYKANAQRIVLLIDTGEHYGVEVWWEDVLLKEYWTNDNNVISYFGKPSYVLDEKMRIFLIENIENVFEYYPNCPWGEHR